LLIFLATTAALAGLTPTLAAFTTAFGVALTPFTALGPTYNSAALPKAYQAGDQEATSSSPFLALSPLPVAKAAP